MLILIVASLPLLSITTISTSLFKQGTGILPNANALPVGIGEDVIDFPVTAESLLDKRFNKEEKKELFNESPSSFLPSIDDEKPETGQPPAKFDLNKDSAEIIREQGDEIPNQYIVVLKNKFTITPSETASEARTAEQRFLMSMNV